jgi:hypothetical protein
MCHQEGWSAGALVEQMDHGFVRRQEKTGQSVETYACPEALALGRPRNARSPRIGKEVEELIQASRSILVKIGVPGCHQRNLKGMRDPQTEDSHIPGPRDVHQVGTKNAELSSDPAFEPAQQRVAVQTVIHGEGRRTPFQFQRGDGILLNGAGLGSTVNASQRELPALCERGEFPAKRGDAVRLVKGIGEESHA